MTEQPDNEDRITAIEETVTELTQQVQAAREDSAAARTDAAAARVLAAGADRDVNEVRDEVRGFHKATTASLNALRETQVEHGKLLHEHGEILHEHGKLLREQGVQLHKMNGKLDNLEGRFDLLTGEVRSKFDQLAGGQGEITGLLKRLISQQGE